MVPIEGGHVAGPECESLASIAPPGPELQIHGWGVLTVLEMSMHPYSALRPPNVARSVVAT
jgi:hypothetical protein